MSIRTAKKVLNGLLILLIAAAIIFSVLGLGQRGSFAPKDFIAYGTVFTIMVIMAVVAVRYVRCPKCGKSLTREEYAAMQCTRCGEKF